MTHENMVNSLPNTQIDIIKHKEISRKLIFMIKNYSPSEQASISVIIPVYNSGEEAYRAVTSIAKQTLLPLEVILIDDCSPNSEEVKAWLSKIQIDFHNKFCVKILYQTKNRGPGEARNAGWDIATGKYIAFLDSDDIWHPQKLEIQYNFMITHPKCGFSCHHLQVISECEIQEFNEKNIKIRPRDIISISPIRYLFKHYPIGGTSYVMAKNVSDIRFEKGKRYSEDYLVWLEFCFKYSGILISRYMGASFKPFYGVGGMSQNLWKLERGELENYRILAQKGIISPMMAFFASGFSFIKYIRRVFIKNFSYMTR